jgi:hypothetical protein
VLWGVIISALGKGVAIFWPKLGWTEAQTTELVQLVTITASFLGDALAGYGRLASNAQPVTLNQQNADIVGAIKQAQVATTAAANVQHGMSAQPAPSLAVPENPWNMPPPLSAAERAAGWTTVKPEDVPMDHLPLNKVRHEINDVADSVLDIMQGLARLSPLLGVLGTVGKVADIAREASQAARDGEKP